MTLSINEIDDLTQTAIHAARLGGAILQDYEKKGFTIHSKGQAINLELAMGLEARLGGHLVTGHIDGKARLLSRHEDARAERFEFEVPDQLARYIAKKGSVCLDGVSLTVNEVDGSKFSVCLIPHTLEVTTLGSLGTGDEVNLEVDLIARYLERLMDPEHQEQD